MHYGHRHVPWLESLNTHQNKVKSKINAVDYRGSQVGFLSARSRSSKGVGILARVIQWSETMMKRVVALTAVAIALAAPAHAGLGSFLQGKQDNTTRDIRVGSSVMPPVGFTGQRWVHPNGCQYSRTGRPSEVSWTLVATGVRGCSSFFVQSSPYGDMTGY